MGDEKDKTNDPTLGAESPSEVAPLIPVEDDAPLTRSEHKALTEANTALIMEQMNS